MDSLSVSKLPIVYPSILYCLRQARLNIAYHTAAVVRVRFNRGIVILGLNLCSGRWRYKYRRQPGAVWLSCLQDKNGQSCYATFVAVLTVICSNKFGICPSIANKISDSLPIYHLYSAQTCCGRSSQSLLETIVFGRHCECFALYKVLMDSLSVSKLPIVYPSILYCLRQARLNIAYHTAAVVRVRFNRGIVILGLNLCSGRWRYKYRAVGTYKSISFQIFSRVERS